MIHMKKVIGRVINRKIKNIRGLAARGDEEG